MEQLGTAMLDVFLNLVSDFIFVVLIAGLLWLINRVFRRRRVGKAQELFGFTQQQPVRIYVSGFHHEGVASRRVVNAEEYGAAIVIRDKLRRLPGDGLTGRLASALAGLIGQPESFAEPDVNVSPLETVDRPQYAGPIILVGGPLTNQLTSYYLANYEVRFKFNATRYQELMAGTYRDMPSQNNVAILEKIVLGEQVVILAHGYGEAQTTRAVRHLVNNWQALHKQYGKQAFAISI